MQLFLLVASLLGLATLPTAALDQPVFVSSDTRRLLFETSIEVDSTKHQLAVYDGDNPAILARDFAIRHKLDQDGMNSVLKHLKQKALITGNMKRVFFQLPVQVEKQTEKGGETLTEKQVITITIYEDSQPASLAKEVGTLYGLNDGQIAGLSNTIEREMVVRMKLRTTVDLSKYGAGQQTLVVKKDETALPAVQRFAGYMAEVGIELSEAGVKSLAANVEMELINVAVKRAAMEQK